MSSIDIETYLMLYQKDLEIRFCMWFAEGDRGKSEPNQYRSSINFDELSVSDGSLESSFI